MALIPSCSFDEKAPEQYGWEAESTCLCITAHIAYRNQQEWEMKNQVTLRKQLKVVKKVDDSVQVPIVEQMFLFFDFILVNVYILLHLFPCQK